MEFTVKELIQRIDVRLEGIDVKLNTKADHAEILSLSTRVSKLESDREFARGLGRAAWAVVTLLLGILFALLPIVFRIVFQ